MVFNPYIATRPRTSRRQAEDSAGAGAAKIPRVGVNKSDLEAQGELYGWTARELTYTEVREMSSSELRWHEQFNATNLENALATPAKAREGKDIDRQWATKKFWDTHWGTTNQASPEESRRILADLQRFQDNFPQFIASRSENAVLLEWLRDRHMELTYRNLVDSFEANALEGKVWLNPNAISAGAETEVSGQQLLQHHNFFKLIQPQQRMSETDRLSADEYFKQNKETLADRRVPPITQARNAKDERTKEYFAQSASAEARGNVVNVVDYGPQKHGVAPEPDRYSFKQKIRSMSASEIAQRCADDPAFRKSLDELK